MSAARRLVLDPTFLEDLVWWVEHDRKTALRLLKLMDHIQRDPFEGIGKPEPLKYLQPNTWSRRLTSEHRVVYFVTDTEVRLLQGRYHY